MIDGAHRLNRTRCRASESEFTIRYFTLIQCKCTISKNHESAIGEGAEFVFVEIEKDFFTSEGIFTDFHGVFGVLIWMMRLFFL